MTKLDLGRAWNEAMALLSANRDVVLIVAGVFFFLPNAISAIVLPDSGDMEARLANPENMTPEQMLAVFSDYWADSWWITLLVALVQAVGVIGLLALLRDTDRPTVGEALGFGIKALIPYLAAQLLVSVIIVSAVLLLIILGSFAGMGLAIVAGIVGLVAAIYLWVKFSLTSAVIAIESRLNPINALRRSWQLTKGNSLRLFAFYLLLVLVGIVIIIVAGMVLSIFAIAGEQVGLFASAIGGGILSMAVTVIMLAVLAAIHHQLTGTKDVSDTFD